MPAAWSDGTTIHFGPDGAEVRSPDGAVLIEEGQSIAKISRKTICRDGRTVVIS